ncbi:hypothetical protein GALL_393590 [mine drainage metagenome]|uniref:Uncharacterized protein n=1 Tax=mine drainage metagenome TaxID=410659 RepID=A0A1J5Q5F7_9ZZZZ
MQQPRGDLGSFVEAGVAHRVGQAGVGVAADEGVGRRLGQLLQIRTHERGAEGAVQAHGQGLGVAHAGPEGRHGLAGENAPGGVGHGAADDDGQALPTGLEPFVDGEQRGLGVEGVENGFHQEQVHAFLAERLRLRVIGGAQLLESDVARAGVVDVGADAGGLGRGAEGAGDEARLVRRGVRGGAGTGDARGGAVHLIGQLGHAVVLLRDAGGAEGVGLDDVGAGGEIAVVDVADDLRLREVEQLVVAFDVTRPCLEGNAGPLPSFLHPLGGQGIAPRCPWGPSNAFAAVLRLVELEALDHGAHGAVENEDALAQQRRQLRAARVGGLGLCGGGGGHARILGVEGFTWHA